MSFTLHGAGVSGGVAIGIAHLVSRVSFDVAHYVVPRLQVAEESSRLEMAIMAARRELDVLRQSKPANAPSEFDAFLDLHRMILDDDLLSKAPRHMIETEQCNAEWAFMTHAETLLAQFDEIEDPYLRERKADVHQIMERVLKHLTGQPGYTPPPNHLARSAILVAHDLSPADVIQFKQHHIVSFITDVGGPTSHTAILARSLNIPSIVALHHARQLIHENDLLVVDGNMGVVIVNPDAQVLNEYQLRRNQYDLERQKLKRLKTTRPATMDGVDVQLHANIELPDDVIAARENNAAGIGLFRSEFLFLNRSSLPDEDEQFEAYRTVAEEMRGLPVIIRTLDVGSDKPLNGLSRPTENPALGLRAIRLCLAEPRMFHTQLRAILRASFFGKVKLMIPMLTHPVELDQTLHLIEQAKQSLRDQHVKFDRHVEVGGMIEVPAAALCLGMFARKLDFLSIGTNDLIQYTLAIDRTDDAVAHLFDPLHPAVVRLVGHIIRTAQQASLPVSVCGEMAGDIGLTRVLLGLGLREFSMHPAQLLAVKQVVIKSDLRQIGPVTQRMLRTDDPDKIRGLLAKLNG